MIFQIETKNYLSEEGYDNITMVLDVSPPSVEFLRKIESIEPEGCQGDRK